MQSRSQHANRTHQPDPLTLTNSPHTDPLQLCVTLNEREAIKANALGSRHSRSPPIDIPGIETSDCRFRPIHHFEEDLVLHLSKRVQVLERELALLKSHVQQMSGLLKTSNVTGLSRSSPF